MKTAVSDGLAADHLLRLGILGLVIENTALPEDWLHLEIHHNEARLFPSLTAGAGNTAAVAKLRERYGERGSHISVATAEERGLPTANLAFAEGGKTALHLARQGGIGAIMDSKGLKSIIILPENTYA